MRVANMTMNLYAIIVTTILLLVCIVQRRQNKQINKYLIGWMAAHILMLLCDTYRWYLRGKIHELPMFTAMFFLEYALCYVCLIFFHYYFVDYMGEHAGLDTRIRLIVWPIFVIMVSLWVLSNWNRMFYVITYNAVNVPYDYYYLSQVPGVALIVADMLLTLFYRKRIGWRIVLIMWLYMALPIIAFPMQFAWNAEVLFIGMTLSLLARYASITSEQNRLLAESRVRLAESRIAITMSQIQPHFLYNALGSISVLCDINPVSAREATDHFAEYLRMNMDSMKQRTPIPFQTELKHIETYIWLEKMRFGEKLNVEFDIQVKDFQVPALSVQPIVENAVKHGICSKEDGGTVQIRTWESRNAVHIEVRDDGVGFDAEQLEFNDGKLHIGIKNVRERLEMMVEGDLRIRSKPNAGTVAVIDIPKVL